jgi:hypothetical protein
MTFARELWLRMETVHAVTYFAEETEQAGRDLGLSGFWMGYFGFRAAPLGAVSAGVVEATFSNFAPSFVQRWVPDVWASASPPDLVVARLEAAVATLLRVAPEAAGIATAANPVLLDAVDRGVGAGRALFAANRLLALPDEPLCRLWHLCTCLREHRGDGHVAALTAAGVDGIEAHVLIAAEQGNSPEDLQRTRGWSAMEWAAAVERLRSRGLLADGASLTAAGAALRADIERRTDELAMQPFAPLAEADLEALLRALDPLARAISGSGIIRYPNPMGLPRVS